MRDKTVIQSVEKAVHILSLFSKKETQLTLGDISQRTNFNKTTALRLCNTLEKVGFIEKIKEAPVPYYRLGIELFKMGSLVTYSWDLTSRAKPYLKTLTEITGDNSYLFVEKNNKAHCIDTIKGDYMLWEITTGLGDTYNLNQGGGPLAIFAFLNPKKRMEVISELGLRKEEEQKLTDRLSDIRANGYSLSQGEIYPNAAAIGAPIFDFQGNVLGALSIGGVAQRFTEERLPKITEVLKETAQEFSEEFGWEGEAAK